MNSLETELGQLKNDLATTNANLEEHKKEFQQLHMTVMELYDQFLAVGVAFP